MVLELCIHPQPVLLVQMLPPLSMLLELPCDPDRHIKPLFFACSLFFVITEAVVFESTIPVPVLPVAVLFEISIPIEFEIRYAVDASATMLLSREESRPRKMLMP